MVGVFAKADIRNTDHLRIKFLCHSQGSLYNPIRVVSTASAGILMIRHPEKDNGTHTFLPHFFQMNGQSVQRIMVNSRHRFNR